MADAAELRRRLAQAEERNLNAVDAIIGAEAQVAQAKKDAEELFHRLDVRETELKRLKEHLGFDLDTPIDDVLAAVSPPVNRSVTQQSLESGRG